ncbi:MAG: 3-isopropylmalate dehydratase large subunit [Bacteroidetes bacterium]|nr:3-isopropylmalate dehydratase large subunit [Bacteroidota bacterium]MBT5425122.1 3-isopropylmalate dehydratase large subunit [Bacteroidota bacterium]MBT7095031.1 3-isopropylmalate dehydratase large subunit [Bacteroidota bacterium]MBT7466183.1 3-isopropylmalate dehydratase large subunit [Bacteroidota bacterium]
MSSKTIFDKIWDAHEVSTLEDRSSVLYIDRHYIHEVTSPQAFDGLRQREVSVFRPERTFGTADHNVPTLNQHLPISEPASAAQISTLSKNCEDFGISLFELGHEWNGIVHVIGPELGLTLPGMTVVCGDSHTSTHGAFGAVAFGIGTSEVEMVLASQCVLQRKPKNMKIEINGQLPKNVTAKDVALYVISKLGTGGGTGHFVEFCGSAIRSMSMEGRMTLCNMSIEMGARGGLIQPDETTFEYVRDLKFAPKEEDYNNSLEKWKMLTTDPDAEFHDEYFFKAEDIPVMITWGTNPGLAIPVTANVPEVKDENGAVDVEVQAAQEYMGLTSGQAMAGQKIDYAFLGSCTNGRIEDLREFARIVEGKQKSPDVIAWIVPGSQQVLKQAQAEGIDQILEKAGFGLREPGCSACLAMNEDKVPEGKYCISTSNRNFEGRQGPGSRTFLASPVSTAYAAITGKITIPDSLIPTPDSRLPTPDPDSLIPNPDPSHVI